MGARLKNTILVGTVAAVVLCLAGCGKDKGTTPTPPGNTGVAAYLNNLPSWDSFNPVQPDDNSPTGPMTAEMSSGTLCTNRPFSITHNPEAIVTFGTAPDVLWVGSLIQGDSYVQGLAGMQELPIRQRAPLTVAVKLLSGTEISRVVTNPDAASVQTAMSDIIAEAVAGGHQSGSRIFYQYSEAYSSQQSALSMGLSFSYMGFSGKSALDVQTSQTTSTVTAYLKQIMFEAFIVRPQTPVEFFSSDFTKERLDEQVALGNIGPTNLPVYVARVQYGRMLMFSMTAQTSMSKLSAAVSAGYNGLASVDVSIRTEVENILQTAQIKMTSIGGADTSAFALIRTGDLASYFAHSDPLTTAEPMSYALCNLEDGALAKVSETTSYSMDVCSEADAFWYDNKTEWEIAAANMAGPNRITEFQTTAANMALANEIGTPPGSNNGLPGILNFDSLNTGLPFTFRWLAASFTFDDREGSSLYRAFGFADSTRCISIGDVDDYENDNFTIDITGWRHTCGVFAIGVNIGDNEARSEEYTDVRGTNGFFKRFDNGTVSCQGRMAFMGVISTVPITSFFFNEDNGGDDICVQDLYFGTVEW